MSDVELNEACKDHLDLGPYLKLLHNLQELEVTYGYVYMHLYMSLYN